MRDKIWLSTKNIKTKKPLKKLDYKQIKLFKVKKLVKSLYKLDLSMLIKIHNIFHPNLLRLMATNSLPRQCNPPPSFIIADKREKKK